MSITIKKYIDITTAVAGSAAADNRELMQRIFTENPLVPVNGVIEITTLAEVGTYFGTGSEEYKRAIGYFGFISKSATRNDVISFSGYSLVPVEALILGNQEQQSLTALNAFNSAILEITIGGFGGATAPIDLSTAPDIATAMTTIESAINALSVDPLVANATVAYDPIGQRVILTAGAQANAPIVFSSPTAGFLSVLGWALGSATSDGSDGETITAALQLSDSKSDNFGAFVIIGTLTEDEVVEAALWNKAQNVKYIYCVPVTTTSIATLAPKLIDIAGTAITLITDEDDDYAESSPAILLGATNYRGANSVINYMYQTMPYPAAVIDTATSDLVDALRVNYVGETQQAGDLITFYQRGVLMGGTVDPLDMNVFANEIWFKDAITVSLLNLLLAVERVSANTTGVLQLTGSMQGSINAALTNGTISIGKKLNDLQKASIKALTNVDAAADQVQNAGYWLEVEIVPEDGETNAVYTLIYSKDDVVRKITGSQILV